MSKNFSGSCRKKVIQNQLNQQQTIPAALAGNDVLAGAQTGSGKTAGFTCQFCIFYPQSIKGPSEGRPPIRALILVPTRELAQQVEESGDYGQHLKLNSMVMIGGVSINPANSTLVARVDILAFTPGRLLNHIGQNTLTFLQNLVIVVLDESRSHV